MLHEELIPCLRKNVGAPAFKVVLEVLTNRLTIRTIEPIRMGLRFAKEDITRFLVVRILPMSVVRIENVGPGRAAVVHRFAGRVHN